MYTISLYLLGTKLFWYQADLIIAAQTRKKKKDNAITSTIIKQRINGDFYINIIEEKHF